MNFQRGYVLLATSVMILLGIAITALLTSKTVDFDQKIENNFYRTSQSFMAAEAGLEYGLAYLEANKTAIRVDANNDGFIDTYTNSQITNVAFSNNTNYTVTYSNPVYNSFNRITVSSKGTADNNLASTTVVQIMQIYPFVPTPTPVPLLVKDNVNLSGSLTISNTTTGTTIWSGGDTVLGGSASTSSNASSGSNSGSLQADVVHHDSSLSSLSSDQFFSNFFGTTKTLAQQSADITYTNSSNTDYSGLLNGVVGQSIWINQTGTSSAGFSGNATIGSPTNPVVLVVNGPLQSNGTTTIYGMVYVMGDWNNSGGGTLDIIGGAVVEGSITSTGSPNITYNTAVLNQLNKVGAFVKVPGSWRDF
ncbi:pilus assembly PilX family protein [Legionella sp. WA2024007413]